MSTHGVGKTYQAPGLVVTPEAAGVAGCVSYWRAGGNVNIEALKDAWVKAGLDPKLLRKAPEEVTALRRAVMEQQDRHRLVRAVGKGAWAIVDETVHEPVEGQPALPPTYTTLCIVRFRATSSESGMPDVTAVDASPDEYLKIHTKVVAAFYRQQGMFDPSDVTGWLVVLAYKHDAVTLRDSGGVYFIPRQSVDFWTRAADVVEAVSQGNHRVFRIPAMKNSEAVAAIVDAVSAEAVQVAKRMEAELYETGDDKLGARAIKTRQAEIEALLAKLVDYEQLLGLQLNVRAQVEAIQASLTVVAMTDESATS